MSVKQFIPLGIALMLGISIGAWTAQSTAQTSRPTGRTNNASRLPQPWSKLTTLTTEQVNKITDLHRNALAAAKAIENKERADIVALLTDEQKIELNRVENQSKSKTTDPAANQ